MGFMVWWGWVGIMAQPQREGCITMKHSIKLSTAQTIGPLQEFKRAKRQQFPLSLPPSPLYAVCIMREPIWSKQHTTRSRCLATYEEGIKVLNSKNVTPWDHIYSSKKLVNKGHFHRPLLFLLPLAPLRPLSNWGLVLRRLVYCLLGRLPLTKTNHAAASAIYPTIDAPPPPG